jgi:hypothetical protein
MERLGVEDAAFLILSQHLSSEARDTLHLERDEPLMSRQAESDQPANGYSNFESALKRVLSVPRSEMLEKVKAEKKRKKTKRSSASRVSSAKN